MKNFSITTRITLWYAVFLIIVAVLLMVLLLRYYDIRQVSAAEQHLIRTIEDVSDRISSSGKDFAKDPSIEYYTNDTYVSVYNEDGSFIVGMKPKGLGRLPEISIDTTQTVYDDQGRQWFVHDTTIYMDESSSLYIRGVMENTGYETPGIRLGRAFVFTIPALLLLALAGGWLISSRAMKPIDDLIEVTNEIRKDGDLSKRVPVPDTRDEAGELARSINGLFDTIEEVVGRERKFTSDVSHELRTPLTIIRTQSEYAMEDQSYAEQALKTINQESRRMSDLITRLLTIARSESGRLHPEMKDVDLRPLLSEMTEEANIAAADRDIKVNFVDETKGDRPTVITDEDLLMRIVLNLLENAIRYGKSPDGYIELRLREGNGAVVITVADDGDGIRAEEQSKVWNRFYRTDEARSKRDSTGLGLAMVDSLTRALGGSIRIVPNEEKKPGELPGAVFELTLPAKQ